MPPQPNPPPPKLPSTTDFNQILNSISLASAKHNTILQSLRARHPTAAAPRLASTSTPAAGKTGFSALGTRIHQKSTAQLDDDEADFQAEPLNAGIGYKVSKGEQEARTATRDLGRKLLGKRGRNGDGRGQVGKRVVQDESDDEEGRSGLGRRKKAKSGKQDEAEGPKASPEEDIVARGDKSQGEAAKFTHKVDTVNTAEESEAVEDGDEIPPTQEMIAHAGSASPPAEADQPVSDKKKRKKKRKKKTSRKKEAPAEA